MSVPDPATTDWIPMGPPLSINPDLTYKGNWASATTYFEGDIVVYANMAYLCVKQSTAAPVPWQGAQSIPLYTSAQMTALTPMDGDMIRLQVDTTAGIEWMFVYRAASASAYKWEFVGGPPLTATVAADETTTTITTWLNLTTPGPLVTIPRAGDYVFNYGSEYYHGTVANATFGISVCLADNAPPLAAGRWNYSISGTAGSGYSSMMRSPVAGISANDVYKVRYYSASAGTAHWRTRWIDVTPVRVS